MQTQMRHTIDNVVDTRTEQLALYNYNRGMLVELNAIQKGNSELPSLLGKDTAHKDVSTKHWLGNPKQRDGTLWTLAPKLQLGLNEKEESSWRVVADDPRESVKTTGKSNVSALDSIWNDHGWNEMFKASIHKGKGKAEVTLVVIVLSLLSYFSLSV
ncbi:hypothetical protein AAF712_002507 [Marasmius tenuissimus]|uniref:Uncharacterized protein n=1 Tax=Marasmius tenuissimus TaxID=585030 RepID=A0ABR3A8L2_9AGAR